MATEPSEFKLLAAELIGDEFAAFAKDAVITKTTGFEHATQAATTIAQTVPMIKLEHSEYAAGTSADVKHGDYMLIGEHDNFDWIPSAENTKIVHDGITLSIKSVSTDPAEAAVIIYVRRA